MSTKSGRGIFWYFPVRFAPSFVEDGAEYIELFYLKMNFRNYE